MNKEMKEKHVTIVCCYNDIQQYKRLQRSLAHQDTEYDLIGIDNRKQTFTSCSSALNSVIDKIETQYVIYSHQDIELPEPSMLGQFVGFLRKIGTYDILGVAGAVNAMGNAHAAGVSGACKNGTVGLEDATCVLSHVRHGQNLSVAGDTDFQGMRLCDTVDECFFGGTSECFRRYPFDEKLCDNWHLYAVERCLNARVLGAKAYVCGISLIHHSSGKINHAYNANFYRIAGYYAKHEKQKVRWVRTVCGSTRTDLFHRTLFYIKREILIRMHRY